MRIAFVHFPGRLARLDAARAGEGPTEFLFGGVELEREGHDVRHYEVDPGAPAGRLARRLVDRQAGLGRLPPHAHAAVLARHEGPPPGARRRPTSSSGRRRERRSRSPRGAATRRLRAPLVGIVAGLLNRPWGRARRATTLPLLREMHAMLYGPGEAPGLEALDPASRRTRAREPLRRRHGVLVARRRCRAGGVLAIGNDGHRDWGRSLQAAPAIDAEIRILTRHPRPAVAARRTSAGSRPTGTVGCSSDVEVREAFREAAVVVVPVKDVPQPSGQSVTLQASACARPVVLVPHPRALGPARGSVTARTSLLVPPDEP